MGFRNLTRRKARTILTVLGVIIGSLSIIIMISIGNGMNSNFNSQVMQQGSLTTVYVNKMGDIMNDKGEWAGSKEQELSDNLVEQIKAIDHVKAVSPVITVDSCTLVSGKYQSGISLMAMNSNTFQDFEFPELQYGKYPTVDDPTPIVFGFSQPWGFYNTNSWGGGQTIQIDFQKKKVLLKFQQYPAAAKKKEFSLPLKNTAKMVQTNSDFDYSAYIDLTYFKKIYMEYCNTLSLEDRKKAMKAIKGYTQIRLNVDNVNHVEKVQDEIEKLGFTSNSMMQYLLPLQDASKTLQMVLGALGFVAMLVSAISIANTMVMSIYERTKEIGIMKVLGCTIRDIRKLFLFEAAMIGLFGGLIGIGLGYLSSWGINKFGAPVFKALMSGNYMYDMTNTRFSIIPLYLPFASLSISISVGLLSGYFPARRATKISAIEAMKTEG
jgi:ABC-type antimicrobial peptide transport system permease subunit